MTKTIDLATTLAIAVLLGGTFIQPASAYDFSNILQNLAGGISGWPDLDTRQTEMGAQITAAANAGQLTAAEANGYRVELARVAQVEAQIKASGRRLGVTDSMSFTNSLNNLATRIKATIDSKTTVNIGSLTDVDALRAQLLKRVTDATSSGALTQIDSANLQRSLSHNNDIENAFKNSSDGTLTTRQVQVVSDDLQNVKTVIEQQVGLAQSAVPQLDSQRAAVETKIAASLAAGTLTNSQAVDFRRELARIANMQTSFIASNGALNGNEIYTLAGQLDRLSDRVDSQISLTPLQPVAIPGQSTAAIDARQTQISRRIDDGLSSGRLTAQTAADLKHELEHIAMLEAAYQSNSSGVTSNQVQKIAAELDEMNARIDQRLLGSTIPVQTLPTAGVDLSTRIEQIRTRIASSIPQGKMTNAEATQLYSDLNQINDNIESARDDSGNLSPEDQISMQGDVDRLNYRVEQILRVRRMGLPQIEARRAQLLNRINDGQNSGKLSRLEASLLKREYNRISRNEAQFKASTGGTLNYNQSSRLWTDLTALDQLLTNEISTRANGSANYR